MYFNEIMNYDQGSFRPTHGLVRRVKLLSKVLENNSKGKLYAPFEDTNELF